VQYLATDGILCKRRCADLFPCDANVVAEVYGGQREALGKRFEQQHQPILILVSNIIAGQIDGG
jgi:hypothetical protein